MSIHTPERERERERETIHRVVGKTASYLCEQKSCRSAAARENLCL